MASASHLLLVQSLDIFNLNTKTSTRVIKNVIIEALEEKSFKSGCVLYCYRVRKSPFQLHLYFYVFMPPAQVKGWACSLIHDGTQGLGQPHGGRVWADPAL